MGRFSGRIWPDWGNTTRADLAGLESLGLSMQFLFLDDGPFIHEQAGIKGGWMYHGLIHAIPFARSRFNFN